MLSLGKVLRYMVEESLHIMNQEMKHFLYYDHISIILEGSVGSGCKAVLTVGA